MDASVAQLKAEIAELKAERDQSESVFTQLERQFHEQQEEVSSVRADRDRLNQANRTLGKHSCLSPPGVPAFGLTGRAHLSLQRASWTQHARTPPSPSLGRTRRGPRRTASSSLLARSRRSATARMRRPTSSSARLTASRVRCRCLPRLCGDRAMPARSF